MERSREYDDIAVALAEARPAPRPDFCEELDELVAAGFRRDPRAGRHPLSTLADRLRGLSPRRTLLATGGSALAAIALATVLVAGLDSGSGPATVERHAPHRPARTQFSAKIPALTGAPASAGSSAGRRSSEESNAAATVHFSESVRQRQIERSAEIGLLAEPDDVAADSAKVFSAVHDARGIVLHSTTTAGRNAGADFDLLIPSARLGDALAAFSAIDEVRTRHEATTDITAPTVALGEQLQDSRAKVDGLLAQLATTESESEREAIEIELSRERHHAAVLRARLDRLHRRADYSRVSLRIETGASSDSTGGGWGIDDAFHDAGHILGIAAGVTLIALAVLTPLALIALLAWLAHHFWLRTSRGRALDA